ncbi:hypothetical protein SCD_n02804 [Sulfuricella denitrificans skB26]|uniref:Transposase n=1 Tax=Sulfuricella denitrificans (strain DSM 22764 / NBRC 105220 / skB26) TaxID=1163617 RepID=S6ADN4_SULDS|nr:hypothetical protein SCD_n02804 [Sulfuricella denitrificans skB26]
MFGVWLPDNDIDDAIYASQTILCFVGIALNREATPTQAQATRFKLNASTFKGWKNRFECLVAELCHGRRI